MLELVLKLIVITFILVPACYASYWVLIKPIDFRRSFLNMVDEKVKTPAQELLDKPLGNLLVTRDPNKIYNSDGLEIGTVSGNVIEEENNIYFFPRISNTPLHNPQTFEMEWNKKKFKLVRAETFVGMEFPSGEKNVLTNARFKQIKNPD